MKKRFFFKTAIMAYLITAGTIFTSCEKDSSEENLKLSKKPLAIITVGGLSTSDYHMTNDNEYILDGKWVFTNGAKLTIDPGVVIKGEFKDDNTKASAIVITKGSKIIANGTASNPIIMTAKNGQKGGWGGLVILGNAQTNKGGVNRIEGIDDSISEEFPNIDFTYGSDNSTKNDESSGSLKYVRVEYAGASISPANELNSFTFGGVGSGTTLEYLQAYHGADDGFEFFGGTVNAKWLVATAVDDDAFDFDLGYVGKLQFLISNIDPTLNYSSDPNGIECDNDGSGSSAQPFTNPVISNLTIVGTNSGKNNAGVALKSVANFRRNTQFTLVNSVLYGFPKGILHETSNSYVFENNIVGAPNSSDALSGFSASNSNKLVTGSAVWLTLPFNNPASLNTLRPNSNETKLGASFSGMDPFFTPVTYKGAFAPTGAKWNVGWVKQ